jgi:hypothetical protein
MNLLDDYKPAISGAMKDIFDTFKRDTPLRFYKPSVEDVVIFDEEFNSDLQEYSNPNAELQEQSQEFYCRIIYPKAQDTLNNSIKGGANMLIKGEQDLGILYIQMEKDAYDYLEDTTRFNFMGQNYRKLSADRKLGMLGTFNLYQINLQMVN